VRKSLTSLAGAAAFILMFGVPVVTVAAQSEAPVPAEGKEATTDRTAVQAFAAAQARLAFSLIEKIANGNNAAARCSSPCMSMNRRVDATISPASLAAAFGIVSQGADHAMKAAIARALGFSPEQADAGLAALADVRGILANVGDTFQSASRIVFAPSSPPNRIMQAGLENLSVDYSIADLSDPEAAAKIDAWIKEVTNGAIPEILGGPVAKSSLVALNALHFKSRWKSPFDPALTTPAAFVGVDGKSGEVAMMRLGRGIRAFRQERKGEHGFVAIDLPFVDERFSLVVVTTTDKVAPARDFAPAAAWLTGAGFMAHAGDLAMPRFSASGRQDLMPVLDALGLDKARHTATALQGFAPGAMLSQVVQRAMIEIDEEGAEAAAATAVMSSRALEADDAIHMVVDKPFIYALRDKVTGLILVAGYVGHPPKGKTAVRFIHPGGPGGPGS
jgi:serine protease inhibitor